MNWSKLWTKPRHMHMTPQRKAMREIQSLGVTFFRTRLLGISDKMYRG